MEIKRYLDKILVHLVRGTHIDYEEDRMVTPFSFSLSLSTTHYLFLLPITSSSILSSAFYLHFSRYCKNHFGLTEDEIRYVMGEYKIIILTKIESGI